MPRKLQASFTGGELDPRLHARVDLAKYATGAAHLSNWQVHPFGGASNRPGTEFLGFAANEALAVRLVAFEQAFNDTCVLEFGHLYMRVWRQGSAVLSGSVPYTLTTPYAYGDLLEMSFTQSNDVLNVTHTSHPPRKITRFDLNDWRISDLSIVPPIGPPATVSGLITQRALATDGSEGGIYVEGYNYCVTSVDTVTGRESLISDTVSMSNDLTHRGFHNRVRFSPVTGALLYRIYKTKQGVFGQIGTVEAGDVAGVEPGQGGNLFFNDYNFVPDTTTGVPKQKNPFDGFGNAPRVSAYFQQRVVYGGPALKPNRINLSQSGDFSNFNTSFPTKDSDAIEFALAGKRRQDVLFMVSVEDLLVFTSSGEWRVRGTNEGTLTPASIDARQQSEYGCSRFVQPLVVQNDIVFVQAKGQRLRSIAYDFGQNKYKGDDLSLLAAHLFDGKTVVSMSYAEIPYSQLLCVMSDGTLNAFTYLKDQEVWAWSPHSTDGFYESVAVVSEGEEDTPYFVVRRYLNGVQHRTIERRRGRRIEDVRDSFFVDCGLSYDAPYFVQGISASGVVTCAGHPFATNNTVDISDVVGGLAYDIDGAPTPYGMANAAGEVFSGRFQVTDVAAGSFRLVQLGTLAAVNLSSYGPWSGGGKVRAPIQTVSGLSHLNGSKVVGVADGAMVGPFTVSGGSVTLPAPASRVHLGLPYTSDLETLDLDIGQPQLNGELRRIDKCNIHLDRTQNLYYGAAPDGNMYVHSTDFATGETEKNGLFTGVIEGRFPGDWNTSGRMRFRAYLLPATITAIVPEFTAGGDSGGDGAQAQG